MADGRKKNGGARKGAGRKPKTDEEAVMTMMDAVMAPSSVWEELSKKIKDGDTQAMKTWLNYRFGMPKQAIDHTTKGGRIDQKVQVEFVDFSGNEDSAE